MKVAIITRFPNDPTAPQGGVESVSVNLVAALAKLGDIELHVVTTDPKCRQASETTWNGVPVHRLAWTGRKMLTHVTGKGRRQMQEFLTQLAPDVIHAHDVYGLMVKGMDVPRVFTVHGFIYADTLLARKAPRLRSFLWKCIETAGWADQPHIISISPYVRERLAGFTRAVIHDIDNPIAERFFDIDRDEHAGRIFCAAGISRRKNQLGLLLAFQHLIEGGVDAQLRLAGGINDEACFQAAKDFVANSNLGQRVTFLGKLPYEAVREELRHAAVFTLVSLEENSPMAIEEAMAAGVPVVTSNRCGMPYMVRDGESGFLVDPHDPEDIAARLADVLNDPVRRAVMGQHSREIARDRFHPARIACRTRGVYLRSIRDHVKAESHASP
jgi:glycosyltransferase involved in cell wall biosynthesis